MIQEILDIYTSNPKKLGQYKALKSDIGVVKYTLAI